MSVRRKRSRKKGAELLEFTLIILPLLAMVTVLVDTAWAIFAESTLQRAVRIGVRTGVTLTAADMASGGNLTNTVKTIVQQNAMGMLNGSSGLAKIKVNYYLPPDDGSSASVTDVSAQASGNAPGNIMKVSVQNFSLVPLMPRIFPGNIDNAALAITVSSADVIEPSNNPPPIGPAP
jgi:Flp pilus assembly protein TadG